MTNRHPSDDELASHVSQQLQAHSEQLPQQVLQKLHQARQNALAAGDDAQTSNKGNHSLVKYRHSRWAGAAFAALASVTLWFNWPSLNNVDTGQTENSGSMVQSQFAPDDWELVVANQDYELLAHDLEFYQWLAETDGMDAI